MGTGPWGGAPVQTTMVDGAEAESFGIEQSEDVIVFRQFQAQAFECSGAFFPLVVVAERICPDGAGIHLLVPFGVVVLLVSVFNPIGASGVLSAV